MRAELDRGSYPTSIKISDAALSALNIKHDASYRDGSDILSPKRKRDEINYAILTRVPKCR
jgi:hypothetical protein